MTEAYLVEAVRTPVGRRGGGLAAVHPADLGAHVLQALLARGGVDPAAVDDVIFGCVDTIGPQAGNIARTAWLAARIDGGRFDREIAPVAGVIHDEGQRRDTTLAKMAALPALTPDGVVTAALASQVSDGAAALLVASEHAVAVHGLRPRARIHHL